MSTFLTCVLIRNLCPSLPKEAFNRQVRGHFLHRRIKGLVNDCRQLRSLAFNCMPIRRATSILAGSLRPSVRHAILPRTFEGSLHGAHAQRANGNRDLQAILGVAGRPMCCSDAIPLERHTWRWPCSVHFPTSIFHPFSI